MKTFHMLFALALISTSALAQVNPIQFEYPLTIGTQWTYKYFRQAGITGGLPFVRGIHIWEVVSKNEYADSVVYNLVSTNQDTLFYFYGDSILLRYSSVNFTITVKSNSIIDGWPSSLDRYGWYSVTVPRFLANDTLVFDYYPYCTYVNKIGLLKYTEYFHSNNTEIDTLRLLSFKKAPTNVYASSDKTTDEPSIIVYHNYPNPFNPYTTIQYYVPYRGIVKISIVDIQGKLVRTAESQTIQPGTNSFLWDSKDNHGNAVSSGIYFCHVTFNRQTLITKLLLLK